ncbi:uncharacterized protein LOC128393504 [Panonychus citri]|uniref:uncharacterized protein LOC128393504 n=1 Tax=Panonychus citri TaxID=50023 RepID=UPI002307A3D3|nr:uncharacterized protein LOC128393504 [Panonychus citri]
MYSCNKCNRLSKRKHCYNCSTKYKCDECKRTFLIKSNFDDHIVQCQSKEIFGLADFDPFVLVISAFKQFLVIYKRDNLTYDDLDELFNDHRNIIENLFFYINEKLKCFKFQICVFIHFVKPNDGNSTTSYICSSMKTITTPWNSMDVLNECQVEISATIDSFTNKGSGWAIDEICTIEIRVAKYRPDSGGCYKQKLPDWIHNKKAIISPNCERNCFIYSVLMGLYPQVKNAQKVSKYKKYLDKYYDFKGVVKISEIPKFEKVHKISINIYSLDYDEKFIIPLQLSKFQFSKVVNLFLHEEHYYYIKSFDRLINTKAGKSLKRCHKCLQGFSNIDKFLSHQQTCQSKQLVLLPQPNTKIGFIKFKALEKYPFIVYADFETLAKTIDNDIISNTFEYQKHIPSSFGFVCVNWMGEIIYSKFYRGTNTAAIFFDELNRLPFLVQQIFSNNIKPLTTTIEQDIQIQNEPYCWICKQRFEHNQKKVRDHNHLTGQLRGAAHSWCNLEIHWDGKIPVVFHNLKNFDGHILVQAMNRNNVSKVSVIPNTMEKYSAIYTRSFIFIDSYAFLASSLDSLASNLDEQTKVRFLSQMFPSDKINNLMKKGALPYEYIDDWSKFDDTELPPIDKFHSTLTNSTISDEIYLRLQSIWNEFSCKNLGEFQDIYLKVDVILLAAIFESFRDSCLKEFQLDPAHYISIPSLSWDSALRMTNAGLELLSDIDMITMIENGIRGGISCAMTHHVKANNPLVPGYRQEEPHSYITYLDVNNLYGWALARKLPTYNFKWVEDFDEMIIKIKNGDEDKGYILEVDLEYPTHLHDWHDDYPLAVEKLTIHEDKLSPHQTHILQLMGEIGRKRVATEKLIPNLMDKKKYIIYYKNLKYYLEKGLILTKVHRAIEFIETAWLEPYIMMCTNKRQQAKNSFEKDLYKLMVNSLYGKSIEDKRKHSKVEIPMSRKKIQKLTKNPLFDQFMILDENKAICKLRNNSVVLDKPIHFGFTVLEYAKLKMYQLHYDTFKSYYGNKIKLIYTDTDSFIYHIQTNNFTHDLINFKDIMDFCDYPKNHPLQSDCHKKMLGYLKDEMNGKPIHEVIAIKPKMYLIKSDEGEKKTAKGVQRVVLKQQIKYNHFFSCLYDYTTYRHTMHRLQSKEHQIYAVSTEKVSLSPLDDKRWAINPIETYAYGNYKINMETLI